MLYLHENLNNDKDVNNLLDLVLGSLGPSTVTLMAFMYVATITGRLCMIIVIVKLFPVKQYIQMEHEALKKIVSHCIFFGHNFKFLNDNTSS